MRGLGLDQQAAEGLGPVVDRLAERLEHARVGILRGVFQQLREGVDLLQRVMADVVQLCPEAIEE